MAIEFVAILLYNVAIEMTRKDKRLKRFLENPESLKFSKIESILYQIGFIFVSSRGSHRKYRHFEAKKSISTPVHKGDCRRVYKNEIADIIKQIIYERHS